MHVELGWRELTNPPAISLPREAVYSAPRGLTPPRLRTVDPEETRVLPRVVTADVRLNAEAVNQRAEAEVAAARSAGAPHSMRVWRESHQRAVSALAREAAGVLASARCEAITWEQDGAEYHVSATFTVTHIH